MEEELKLLNRIAPDLMMDISRRAQVLVSIEGMQPVGRRALAARLNLPEREVRAAAAILKEQGLIWMDAAGMQLTSAAQEVLPGARNLWRATFGLVQLEHSLSRLLGVPHVIVVPGNANKDVQVLREVGKAAAYRLQQLLKPGMILAVGGGSTMSEVAHGMANAPSVDVLVVPARGGMGSSIDYQANTVAAEIAARTSGRHRAVHMPDTLDQRTLQELMRLPEIQETVELLKKSDLVLHGVGRADEMAIKRGLTEETIALLREKKAVGETFGGFFDFTGQTVWQTNTITVRVGQLRPECRIIVAAAGEGKAEAIIGVLRHEQHDTLITDEAAALRIEKMLSAPQ